MKGRFAEIYSLHKRLCDRSDIMKKGPAVKRCPSYVQPTMMLPELL